MTLDPRRTVALKLLAATGMWRSNYEPPLLRVLWWLGIDAPPPHFATFAQTALVSGTGFAFCFSLVMWLIEGSQSAKPLWAMLLKVAISSVLFGLFMARYYAYGRVKYALPRWSEL